MEKLSVSFHVAGADLTFLTQDWGRHTWGRAYAGPPGPKSLVLPCSIAKPTVGPVGSEARHTQVTSWPRTPHSSRRCHLLTLQDSQAYTLVSIVTNLPPHTTGVGTSTQRTHPKPIHPKCVGSNKLQLASMECGFPPGKHLLPAVNGIPDRGKRWASRGSHLSSSFQGTPDLRLLVGLKKKSDYNASLRGPVGT